MEVRHTITFILLLVCAPITVVKAKTAQFPAKGTPYLEARASLLRQGLVIASDPRPHPNARQRAALHKLGIFAPEQAPFPDKRFREITCRKQRDESVDCTSLFLENYTHGWRNYVVVRIDPKNSTVIEINYPSTVEGLPSIPPPLASDVPPLTGAYLDARKTLRILGFQPVRNHNAGLAGSACFDEHCDRYAVLPETDCSGTGLGFCTAFWISPNKRVLRVTTVGEDHWISYHHWRRPQIYFVQWSTQKELQEVFGK